jgi:hypothetical protein
MQVGIVPPVNDFGCITQSLFIEKMAAKDLTLSDATPPPGWALGATRMSRSNESSNAWSAPYRADLLEAGKTINAKEP